MKEILFDYYHRCKTYGDEPVDHSINKPSLTAGCENYEATPIGLVHLCIRVLIQRGVELNSFNFFDIGCGKGRVILEVMKYEFVAIEGIEISAKLVVQTRKNLENARFFNAKCRSITIRQGSAEQVYLGQRDAILYMFHPFSSEVMVRFVDNIIEQINLSGCNIYLIYYNPLCHELLAAREEFSSIFYADRVPDWSERHACPLAIYSIGKS